MRFKISFWLYVMRVIELSLMQFAIRNSNFGNFILFLCYNLNSNEVLILMIKGLYAIQDLIMLMPLTIIF
ncbi:MAG: hypothetical protein A3F13_09780 [Gammaproteobacteria bacterium RIFCSPHIGHO2_12_FULL_40_19]|nr:MAG: hypothetical protein A3F13_09780 [Gammaproteobacteria bacterium RIFCSPHIGHO2_12_FULL_40_19]